MTQVSELLAIKIENCHLKFQQHEQAALRLVQEREALVRQAAAEVGAREGQVYNTETRVFIDPPKPVPFRAPANRERKRKTA